MKPGDTFFIRDRAVDSHLWVILSDPDVDAERVVMVSMTTHESHKEDVCLLHVGDHPRVSHETCIAYDETRMTTLEQLRALTKGGHLVIQAPVSADVLKRIRDGVSLSSRIKFKYIEILIDQGIIE